MCKFWAVSCTKMRLAAGLRPDPLGGATKRILVRTIDSSKFAHLLKIYPRSQNVHATFLWLFFPKCRFCPCCEIPQWAPTESCYQVKRISCIFEAIFFINGAVKSATLLQFSPVLRVSLVIGLGLPPTHFLWICPPPARVLPCQTGTEPSMTP